VTFVREISRDESFFKYFNGEISSTCVLSRDKFEIIFNFLRGVISLIELSEQKTDEISASYSFPQKKTIPFFPSEGTSFLTVDTSKEFGFASAPESGVFWLQKDKTIAQTIDPVRRNEVLKGVLLFVIVERSNAVWTQIK
jgi:hypothetical protein